jgi:glyoxylase-like metal-dependent hydrolase (beta-lactamase superfamily II)/ferredoxin
MARDTASAARNAAGDLFVDTTCIACDTCRRIAPAVYGGEEDEPAFVARQPADPATRQRALMALLACPVAAIGSRAQEPREALAAAARAFPEPEAAGAPGVLACGYASERSYGAASWLLLREGGHVLVDSPRFVRALAERIRRLGGIRFMFLTHRDDVADHARWREAFGCERILHAGDVGPGTRDVERIVEGSAPVALAPDLLVVPVPGHTPGSSALLAGQTTLFSGDHLWGDAAGALGASRDVCWWDWAEQVRSMERLASLRFRWVLPGHGRPWRAPTAEAAQQAVAALARAMAR